MSFGSSIEKTRKSPLSGSSSTVHDRLVRDSHALAVCDAERQSLVVGRNDRASKALSAAQLALCSQGHLPTDDVAEMRGRSQRPLQPRGRDVHGVAVEVAAEQVRDALAERVIDAGGMVDVDREPRRARELDGEHLDARKALHHCL